MNDTTQTEDLLDEFRDISGEEAYGMDDAPRVAFESNLKLTREQEDRLVDHCMTRFDQLEKEMGRDVCARSDWWTVEAHADSGRRGHKSWMGKRELYDLVYHNDVEWRRHLIGQIYEKSNFVAPIARRITRQMVARATNYFFGTDPWFAATPVGRSVRDRTFADKINRFSSYKLKQTGSVHEKRNGIELGFVRGECVMKTIYKRLDDLYERKAEILIDVTEVPVLDSLGGFIYKHDRWVDEIVVDEVTGEQFASGDKVLERDGVTKMPDALIWDERVVTVRNVLYDGPESKAVYFKDFLCPLTAATIDEADCCIHVYDLPFIELADTYRRKGALNASENPEATIKAVEMLRQLTANDGRRKSLRNSGDDIENDDHLNEVTADSDPMLNVAECWVRFDANQDGVVENLMVIIDTTTRLPIFYEYTANVTEDGKRPFTVIRPQEIDGRWYGIGAMEMFESAQSIIDLLVNRWNLSHSESGRVTFWDPSKTFEGDSDPHLKLNQGKTYTLKPGVEPDKVVSTVPLYNVEHRHIKEMFELFIQMAMNESGISNANDANAAGLDQAKLATGIRNIEKSGMEMFAIYISALEPGLEETTRREIAVLLANLKDRELFDYFDGRDTQLLEITPEEVRNLAVNVSILLTRYRNEQAIQQAWAGIEAVKSFYEQPYSQQIQTATFYRMIIKALDMAVDEDAVIQPLNITPEERMAAAGGSTPNPDRAAQAAADPQRLSPDPNL